MTKTIDKSLYRMCLICCTLAFMLITHANVRGDDTENVDSQSDVQELDMDSMVRSTLVTLGIAPTAAGLIEGLHNEDSSGRSLCLYELSKIASLDQIPLMADLCDDPERFVRITAIRAIHRTTSRHTQAMAQEIWDEAEYKGHIQDAAVLLCEVGDPSRYDVILNELNETDGDPISSRVVQVVPLFAKYYLRDEEGELIDWESTIVSAVEEGRVSEYAVRSTLRVLREIGIQENTRAVITQQTRALVEERHKDRRNEPAYALIVASSMLSYNETCDYQVVLDALKDPADPQFVYAVVVTPKFATYEPKIRDENGDVVDWLASLEEAYLSNAISNVHRIKVIDAIEAIGTSEALALASELSRRRYENRRPE